MVFKLFVLFVGGLKVVCFVVDGVKEQGTEGADSERQVLCLGSQDF